MIYKHGDENYKLEYLFKEGEWVYECLLDCLVYHPPTAAIKATQILPEPKPKTRLKYIKDKVTGLLRTKIIGKTPKKYGFYTYMEPEYFDSHDLQQQLKLYLIENFADTQLTETSPTVSNFVFTKDKEK